MEHNARLQRKHEKDRKGIVIIVLVVIVIAALVLGLWYLQQSKVKLDKDTFCPVDGPRALTVILIDQTDYLNPAQQEAVRVRLDKVRSQTPQYGAIALFPIGATSRELLHPSVYLCNPGAPSEASPLYQNVHHIEQRWQIFTQKLDQAFTNAIKAEQQSSSPIMESIQSAALSTFARDKQNVPKRLILVSDLLQYSQILSLYQHIPRFVDFKTTAAFNQLRAPLGEAEIEILFLRRPSQRSIQGKALIEFWQQYLQSSGGVLTKVISIEG